MIPQLNLSTRSFSSRSFRRDTVENPLNVDKNDRKKSLLDNLSKIEHIPSRLQAALSALNEEVNLLSQEPVSFLTESAVENNSYKSLIHQFS